MSHSEKPVKTWPAALNLDTLVANTGGTLHEFDLDRAKLTSGGWELPSLDGTAHCGALTGVIVYWRDCRARWEGELGGVPVCYSKEAKIGTGIPGGDCASCEYAQFGSDAAGRGQACKLMRQLLVLLQGELLPKVATLPPTSISPCRKYFLRLASVGKPIWSVVTELATTTAKNAQGIVYPVVSFRMTEELDSAVAEQLRQYGNVLGSLVSGAKLTAEDYLQE